MIRIAMIIIKHSSKKEKKVKILAIFILTTVLTIGVAFGSLSAEAAETSGSASVEVMSSYIWRGFEIHEDVAVQPSVGITYGGFGANLWSDYNTYAKEAIETDLTLNYSFSRGKISFDAGYIFYALDGAEDTQELYLTVGYDTLLSPSLTVYYDFDEGDGAFMTASIGHALALPKDLSLDLGASVSYNMESEYSIGDYSDFHNGELTASLSFPVNDAISISPMIAYSFALSDDAEAAIESLSADGDESDFFYGGLNMSLSF
jgi:hypothetical protein